MAKILTDDDLKELFDKISANPFLITILEYEDLVQVFPYAERLRKSISDEIDRLITETPDYISTEGLEHDKVFRYWATRYNAGEYLKIDNIYSLLSENLFTNKTFEDKIGLTEYRGKHGSEPYFQFTDNTNNVDIGKNKKRDLKLDGYTATSVVLAYYYLKECKIYPIIEFQTDKITSFYKKLAEDSGFKFNLIRRLWPAMRLVSDRTKKNNLKNITLSIQLLKTFTNVDCTAAITLAISEQNKASLKKIK